MVKFFISILIMTACLPRSEIKDRQKSNLKWGHLLPNRLKAGYPNYLINFYPEKSGGPTTYNICIASNLFEAFPNIKTEIQAAANIWAFYLGRNIPFTSRTVDFPRLTTYINHDIFRRQLYQRCKSVFPEPEIIDIVVSLAPFSESSNEVANTGTSYSYYSNENIVTSFERHMFIRDFNQDPLPNEGTAQDLWISYSQSQGQNFSQQEIEAAMKNRNVHTINWDGERNLLPVLMHEFGHVWGLCDQYDDIQVNCDAEFRSGDHPVKDSVMGSVKFVDPIYLKKDDVDGLQTLALRTDTSTEGNLVTYTPDFLGDASSPITFKDIQDYWVENQQSILVYIFPDEPINETLEFFRFYGSKVKDQTLYLVYGYIASEPLTLRLSLQSDSSEDSSEGNSADCPVYLPMSLDTSEFQERQSSITLNMSAITCTGSITINALITASNSGATTEQNWEIGSLN